MLSNINDEYRRILNDMEENISNSKDLEFAKNKIYELSSIYLDEMQAISEKYEDRINAILMKQHEMDEKIEKVEKDLKEMKLDIYDDEMLDQDENFEFEITCPYCNYEFVTEVDENKKEVICPECENLIELDWDGLEEEGYCGGSCSHCHGCESDEFVDEDNDDDDDDM